MPYKIAKVAGGYKVKHGSKAFSKSPKTKEGAETQRRAIAAGEFGHGSKKG
jgi:hypothetical protein